MGNNKLAILVSCTNHYNERMYVFDDFLSSNGYKTQYISSNFHHIKKIPFKCDIEGVHQISVRPYKKNLSIDRILSHRDFAKNLYKYLENLPQEPAIIVSEIPPNFIAKYLAKYKKHHPNVKLVLDIFDLWPETFPTSNLIKKALSPAFWVWKSLRDCNLSKADLITTECNMYNSVLSKQLQGLNHQTVYLCRPQTTYFETADAPSDNTVELCYLGSMNNIIDIDTIADLTGEISKLKNVRVHIIGEGEKKEAFIEKLRSVGAEVVFYGAVYDTVEKQHIFNKCHFGINMMKSTVCIGLTMKSLDYFAAGLPILNTVSGDTESLVINRKIGINVDTANLAKTAKEVIQHGIENNNEMRKNVLNLFNEQFCQEVILQKIKTEIEKL